MISAWLLSTFAARRIQQLSLCFENGNHERNGPVLTVPVLVAVHLGVAGMTQRSNAVVGGFLPHTLAEFVGHVSRIMGWNDSPVLSPTETAGQVFYPVKVLPAAPVHERL